MQAVHAVCPSASWKLPAAHLEQMDAPVASLYVPGAHAVGAVLAVPQLLPIVHSVHASAEPRSVALEYVPAGHGSGAAEPSPQK